MERGEVWWAVIGEKCPVVLLSRDGGSGFRAMQIVTPATDDEHATALTHESPHGTTHRERAREGAHASTHEQPGRTGAN